MKISAYKLSTVNFLMSFIGKFYRLPFRQQQAQHTYPATHLAMVWILTTVNTLQINPPYYKIVSIHVKANECSIVGSYLEEIASTTKNTITDLYAAFLLKVYSTNPSLTSKYTKHFPRPNILTGMKRLAKSANYKNGCTLWHMAHKIKTEVKWL